MRKLMMISIVLLAVLCMSCNNALQQFQSRQASVTIAINGGDDARALGSNGLPILSRSELTIKVTKTDGTIIKKQDFNKSDGKTLSLTLPVGEQIKVRVTVKNDAAQWSGETEHTVTAGINTISVKIKKNAAALNSLLFTQTKSETTTLVYDLTLYMGGKTITVPQSNRAEHVVARDNKGRTLLAYHSGNEWKVKRYTSEGYEQTSFDAPNSLTDISAVINDLTTGNSYAIQGNFVYTVKENEIDNADSPLGNVVHGLAAIDNRRVVWVGSNSHIYGSIGFSGANVNGMNPNNGNAIGNHIKIDNCKSSKITDIFIRGDYVYVLFKTVNTVADSNASNLYSLGGVVRYKIEDVINNTANNPVKIGFDDDPDFENGGLKTYDYTKNFYGAVKVIGFDEENLYIADDGFDTANIGGRHRITKNRNRIATLNIQTNTVSFEDTETAKWYDEPPVWEKPAENPLVFFTLDKTHPNRLDKLVLSNDVSGSSAINVISNIELDNDNSRNIFYTFDRDNNFYLVTKDKLKKFTKSDSSYTEDTTFKGASDNAEAYQNPAYDIVTEKLYAVGKYSGSAPSILVEYTGGNWVGRENNSVNRSDVYAVYNGIVYHTNGDPKIRIQAIGNTINQSQKVAFDADSVGLHMADIFVADDICYVLKFYSNKSKIAIAYFDVTKVNALEPDSHGVKIVPASQVTELPIEGLTEFENLKFTGYRDGKLYIAIDGIKRSAVEDAPKRENINKTVSFNTSAKTFDSPVNPPTDITWFREENEWHGTKPLVWTKNSNSHGFDYYQLDSETASSTHQFSASGVKYSDLCCYDAYGNLYIAAKDNSSNKLFRYTLNDDGSYGSGVSQDIYAEPEAMAVSLSSVAEDSGKTILFYYNTPSGSGHQTIKRIAWPTDNFNDSDSKDDIYLDDLTANDTITALAASKEGVFVAVKTVTGKDTASEKYKIEVRKYTHQKLSGESPAPAAATVTVVGQTSSAYSTNYRGIEENLNALYIQDGVLYGLTTKEFRNDSNTSDEPQKASISGKVWKIGKTDSTFGGSAQVLHSSEPTTLPGSYDERKEGGKFAPYRFIAIKPKKLVIASDGFYGYMEGSQRKAEQYNLIWTFGLTSDGSIEGNGTPADKGESITFSKSLDNGSYFSWE